MASNNSKSGKCVLLIRVSTTTQDYSEQEFQVKQLAISEGYDEKNIISIARKESGRKVEEEERKGLQEFYQLIDKENITCVFARQIDRISRRRSVLFKFVEVLQQRHIQLIIQEPFITLFNQDGTENMMASMCFVMYAQLAEIEMTNKLERFRMGAQKLARNNKGYSEKSLPYGYILDDNRNIVIDEHEAEVVRSIFQLYIDGMSYAKITRHINSLGNNLTTGHVRAILHKPAYTGETTTSDKWGINRTLPAIIDTDTFNQANSLADEHKRMKKANTIYWCEGLIHDDEGNVLNARNSPFQYYSKYSKGKGYLNVELVDSCVWHYVKPIYAQFELDNYTKNRSDKQKELKQLRKQLDVLEKSEDKWNAKRERILEQYEDGYYSRDKRDSRLVKLEDEMREHNAKKASIQVRINLLSTQLNSNKSDIVGMYSDLEQIISNLDKLSDEQTIKEIISKFVFKITYKNIRREIKEISIFTHEYPENETFAGHYILFPKRKKAYVKNGDRLGLEVPIVRSLG